MMNIKASLLLQLQECLERDLLSLQKSMENAAEGATHPESKPENKYDTRGLESSYLAGAQKERLAELRAALHQITSAGLRSFASGDKILPSALIEVEQDGQRSFCFLMLVGAGYTLDWNGQAVLTITPRSPLGEALLGKQEGDVVQLKTSNTTKDYEIIRTI